jgi:hypothetical protein
VHAALTVALAEQAQRRVQGGALVIGERNGCGHWEERFATEEEASQAAKVRAAGTLLHPLNKALVALCGGLNAVFVAVCLSGRTAGIYSRGNNAGGGQRGGGASDLGP